MSTLYRHSAIRPLAARLRRFAAGLAVTILAFGLEGASFSLSAQQSAPALALEGVTVIDVTDGERLSGQTVVIAGNRIQAMGPAGQVMAPAGAQIVDARGKYLTPGFWDMHAHVDYKVDAYAKFIASGVTGIREMAQRTTNGANRFRTWQQEVMTRARVGPRSIGPSVDLTDPYKGDTGQQAGHFRIPSPEDAPFVMEVIKDAGMAFVKYHDDNGKPDLFFAMLRAARDLGLPFVGHIPKGVTNVQASDSGVRSVEHVYSNHECWIDRNLPLADSATTEQWCAPVVQAYLKNGTWFTPTLVVYFPNRNGTETIYAASEELVRTMHRLGFKRFLTGTDFYYSPAGFGVLAEIVLLAQAGLTPLEALQAATLNPAKYLESTDSLGTVAPNKLADLVLLDADPLSDIRNVMKIRAVIANGRYFDRAALDTLDPDVPKLIQKFSEDEKTLATIKAKMRTESQASLTGPADAPTE